MEQTLQSLDSILARFVAFFPTLIGAAIVLLVGWIIAWALASITNRALEAVGFDRLIQRGKVHETLGGEGGKFDPSRIVGAIVFWAALITTFLLTANILGLTAVSELLARIVAYLPFVAIAVIAIVVAVALAQIAFEGIVALLGERVSGAESIATAAKWSIIAFGIFVALSQLQIAPVIVNGLFLTLIGAIAVAFAISFGVGNIELAKKITGDWYERASETDKGSESEAKNKKRPAA